MSGRRHPSTCFGLDSTHLWKDSFKKDLMLNLKHAEHSPGVPALVRPLLHNPLTLLKVKGRVAKVRHETAHPRALHEITSSKRLEFTSCQMKDVQLAKRSISVMIWRRGDRYGEERKAGKCQRGRLTFITSLHP